MKILVTNNTLGNLGGSETYAYSLIKELNRRENVDVSAFSPTYGLVSNKLREDGIKLHNTIPNEEFDLILASHTSTTKLIKDLKGFKIQTCHGIFPELEQPSKDVDYHVSISYEVRTHLLSKGFNSEIIHNGVNTNRFKPTKLINDKLRNVLSLTQSGELNEIIIKVCEDNGYNLTCLNKFVNPVFDVENYINENDLVISLGRGTFESMACGRNVLVLDKRPYVNKPPIGDGLLTSENVGDFLTNNCSGRFTNEIYNYDKIKTELNKYSVTNGFKLREFAINELNIQKQVDKYLKIYEENSKVV